MLNYNGRRELSQLLDKAIVSALNQTYADVRVLFVDNGSTDDSIEHVSAEYGEKLKIVELGKNYGFCLGNNLGSKHISTDVHYILFMNADTILTENYVERLACLMEEYEWVGMAQGLQKGLEDSFSGIGGYIDSWGRAVEVDITGLDELFAGSNTPFILSWASGSGMMVRRELFDRLKGFSPELFMYHDEIDLCARALFLGYKTVCRPEATFYHKRGTHPGSNGINWFSWYLANRNKWLTALRYLPRRETTMSFLVAFPLEVLLNIIKSFRTKERPRARLEMKIVHYVSKNLRRELAIRKVWADKHHLMSNYIVCLDNPLFKKRLKELAIKKALILSDSLHAPARLAC